MTRPEFSAGLSPDTQTSNSSAPQPPHLENKGGAPGSWFTCKDQISDHAVPVRSACCRVSGKLPRSGLSAAKDQDLLAQTLADTMCTSL